MPRKIRNPECLGCPEELKRLKLPGLQDSLVCPRCGGAWVTISELETALAAPKAALKPYAQWQPKNSEYYPRNCPQCAQKMITKIFEDKSGIELDVCPHGHGIWFDTYELPRVAKFRDKSIDGKRLKNYLKRASAKKLSAAEHSDLAREGTDLLTRLTYQHSDWKSKVEQVAAEAYMLAADKADDALLVLLAEAWDGFPTSVYDKALALSPKSAQLNYRCGHVRLTGDQKATARPYLERAVKLDRTHGYALCDLARMWTELDEPDKAFAFLERANEEGGISIYCDPASPAEVMRAKYGVGSRRDWLKERSKPSLPEQIKEAFRTGSLPVDMEEVRVWEGVVSVPGPLGLVEFSSGQACLLGEDGSRHGLGELVSGVLSSQITWRGDSSDGVTMSLLLSRADGRDWTLSTSYRSYDAPGESRETPLRIEHNAEAICGALGVPLSKSLPWR